ncbi:glycosyltransferase [Pelosinus fermentans]
MFESFGYVAVEVMTLKKPIIASKVGGLCKIIEYGKSGFLF